MQNVYTVAQVNSYIKNAERARDMVEMMIYNYCVVPPASDSGSVKAKLFDVTPDYLGKGLKLSDVYTAVMSTPNVKWCKVLEPVDNIEVNVDEFLIQTYITVNEVIKEYK